MTFVEKILKATMTYIEEREDEFIKEGETGENVRCSVRTMNEKQEFW